MLITNNLDLPAASRKCVFGGHGLISARNLTKYSRAIMSKTSGTLKKIVKLGLNQVQHVTVAAGRLTGLIDFPVPPNSSMRKTASGSIRHYYMSGLCSFMPIAVCAQRAGVRLDQPIRVLDFGCGVGRQLLHFTRHYPKPAFHACDIDDTSVAFIQAKYPQVAAYTSSYFPPLKYEAGFFDMVYSVSIFSHLNPEDQGKWLAEMARVTRPGGRCFLTTHGPGAADDMADHCGMDASALRARLMKEGIVYKEYEGWQEDIAREHTLRLASHLVGVKNSYGNILLSPDFIAKQWPQYGFEVESIVEKVIDFGQDLVVLRRV